MNVKIYDVIICGAGPAGTSAGYKLVSSGLKVLIFDQYKFPRIKSCAGAIPYSLTEDIPELKNIIEAESDEIIFSSRLENRLVKKLKNKINFIMRNEFDMLLLDRAKKQGCIFNESERLIDAQIKNDLIEIKTDKNILLTKYLIGADGALSSVNRIFQIIEKNNGLAINAEIKIKPKIFEKFKSKILIDIGGCENGYFWAFPKKNHISFGMDSSNGKYRDFKKKFFMTLKKMIEDFNERDIIYMKGAPMPFFNRKEKLNKNNVLLVGDAANLVNPFNGAGICFAIKSGGFAADAIITAEKEKKTIDKYNGSLSEITDSFVKAKHRAEYFFKYEKFIASVYSEEKTLELFGKFFLRI